MTETLQNHPKYKCHCGEPMANRGRSRERHFGIWYCRAVLDGRTISTPDDAHNCPCSMCDGFHNCKVWIDGKWIGMDLDMNGDWTESKAGVPHSAPRKQCTMSGYGRKDEDELYKICTKSCTHT